MAYYLRVVQYPDRWDELGSLLLVELAGGDIDGRVCISVVLGATIRTCEGSSLADVAVDLATTMAGDTRSGWIDRLDRVDQLSELLATEIRAGVPEVRVVIDLPSGDMVVEPLVDR